MNQRKDYRDRLGIHEFSNELLLACIVVININHLLLFFMKTLETKNITFLSRFLPLTESKVLACCLSGAVHPQVLQSNFRIQGHERPAHANQSEAFVK